PYPERVRPAPLPDRQRERADLAFQAAEGRLGSRPWRSGAIPACFREPATQENRTRSRPAALSADRAMGRLPLRRLTKTNLILWGGLPACSRLLAGFRSLNKRSRAKWQATGLPHSSEPRQSWSGFLDLIFIFSSWNIHDFLMPPCLPC